MIRHGIFVLALLFATLYGHKVVGIGDLGPLGSKISRLVFPEPSRA